MQKIGDRKNLGYYGEVRSINYLTCEANNTKLLLLQEWVLNQDAIINKKNK